jgi:hypothetical protein
MTTLRALIAAALLAVSFGTAIAKLPPPPPMTEEQKAAAAEKKAKAAAAEHAALVQAQDRVVARYKAEHMGAEKAAAPPTAPAAKP